MYRFFNDLAMCGDLNKATECLTKEVDGLKKQNSDLNKATECLTKEVDGLKKQNSDLEYKYEGLLECKIDIYHKYQDLIIKNTGK
jgi:uncharacterized protein YoxC